MPNGQAQRTLPFNMIIPPHDLLRNTELQDRIPDGRGHPNFRSLSISYSLCAYMDTDIEKVVGSETDYLDLDESPMN